MKAQKKIAFLIAFALNGYILHAAPSFSAVFAGNMGINGDIPVRGGSSKWQIPLSAFAAAQVDFADMFTIRGEIDVQSQNFPLYKIFGGNSATIKIHEFSFVFTKRAVTSTHFISAFLGSYEPIGTNTFLMRQFGVEDMSSPLTKSVTNIAGVPLYSSYGGGASYIMRLDKKPISVGGYLYLFTNHDDIISLNFDLRFAASTQRLKFDFVTGIGAPLKDNSGNDDEYVIAIKTLLFHCGMNMLLGNRYNSQFLLQLGLNNLVLAGGSTDILDAALSFVIEPRAKLKKGGINLTLYSLDPDNVESLLYLTDDIGVGLTFFFNTLETRHGEITAGLHLISSFGDILFKDLVQWKNTDNMKLNFYFSPYAEIPLSSSAMMEVMGQIGVQNVLDSLALNVKVIAGFRKHF